MNKFSRQVKKQFRLRAGEFEKSARWIKDQSLLNLHKKLAGWPIGKPGQNRYPRRPLVLELCCGTGIVGRKLMSSCAKVVGCDLSPDMLRRAKKRLAYCINNNALHLPFKPETFDVIICRQALHFLDLPQLSREIKRVCRPGGRVVLSQIVPFGKQDETWLKKIHRTKQPLLKNFVMEKDVIQLLKKIGCRMIVKENFTVTESINRWLASAPELSARTIRKVKKLFLEAPPAYKKLHGARIVKRHNPLTPFSKGDDRFDILDTMNWVIASGVKK